MTPTVAFIISMFMVDDFRGTKSQHDVHFVKGGWLAQHAHTDQMGMDIALRDNSDLLPARCWPQIFTGIASLFDAQYKLLAGQRRISEPFASVAPRLHTAAFTCVYDV